MRYVPAISVCGGTIACGGARRAARPAPLLGLARAAATLDTTRRALRDTLRDGDVHNSYQGAVEWRANALAGSRRKDSG